METGVHLTDVPTESEAEVVCGMLRAAGIKCGERAANVSSLQGVLASGGGWRDREVLEPLRALPQIALRLLGRLAPGLRTRSCCAR